MMAHFKFKRDLIGTKALGVSSARTDDESIERNFSAIPESPSTSLSPYPSKNASIFTPVMNKQITDLMNTDERRVLSSLQKMGYVPAVDSALSSCNVNESNPGSSSPGINNFGDGENDITDDPVFSTECDKENFRASKKHSTPFIRSPCDVNQRCKTAKKSSTPSTTRINNLSSSEFQSLVQSSPFENLASAADDLAHKVFELDISNDEEFATQASTKYGDDGFEKSGNSSSQARSSLYSNRFSSLTGSTRSSTNFEMSIHASSMDLANLDTSAKVGSDFVSHSSTDLEVNDSKKQNLAIGVNEDLTEPEFQDESFDVDQTESYIAEQPEERLDSNLSAEGGMKVLDLDLSNTNEFMTQYGKEVTRQASHCAINKNLLSESECDSEITSAKSMAEEEFSGHRPGDGGKDPSDGMLIERSTEEVNESFNGDRDSDRTESYCEEVSEDSESDVIKATGAQSTLFKTGIFDHEDGPGGFLLSEEEQIDGNCSVDEESDDAADEDNSSYVHSTAFETGLLDAQDEPTRFSVREVERDKSSADDVSCGADNNTREDVSGDLSDGEHIGFCSENLTKDAETRYWSVVEDDNKKNNVIELSGSFGDSTERSQVNEENDNCIVLSEENENREEEAGHPFAARENKTAGREKRQKYRRVRLDDSDDESDEYDVSAKDLKNDASGSFESNRVESPNVEENEKEDNAGDESWNSPSDSNDEMEESANVRKTDKNPLDDIVKKIKAKQENDSANNRKKIEILPYQYEERHLDPNHVLQGGSRGGANGAVYQASKITVKSLQSLHAALESCPGTDHMSEQPSIVRTVLREHQLHGLQWLLWREHQMPSGGILADDMGLGKTLQMISLIASQKERSELDFGVGGTKKHAVSKSTLVVAPASVMNVWQNEIEKHCRRTVMLSICLFHGNHRVRDPNVLRRHDIVITSYATLAREVAEKLSAAMMKIESEVPADKLDDDITAHTPLLRVLWRRVILDEAHQIKNPRAKCSIAACRLRAQSRWAVTGTPVHNNLKDFFSLLRFLRFSPFDEKHFFENQVEKHKQKSERINLISKFCLLRRTKADVDKEGKALVELPQKNFNVRILPMLPYDRKLHDFLFITSKEKVKKFLEEKRRNEMLGLRPGRNVMTNIFTLLLRLRQSCAHPMLVSQALDSEDLVEIRKATREAEEKMGLSSDKKDGCTNENESRNSAVIREKDDGEDDDELIHEMSRLDVSCVGSASGEASDVDSDKEGGSPGDTSGNKPGFIGEEYELDYLSTKLKTLMQEIETIVEKNEKCVVVSEWTSYLRIASHHLRVNKIKHFTIEGCVPFKERDVAVQNFNTSSSRYKVMLVSLKAGGVGLNLVGGNHLFLLDVHWNPALEAQAVDRIYRMGQSKDVNVHKLVCEDTIEDRVMKVQDNKREIANEVLSGATATKRSANLSLRDLKYIFGLDS